jgi:hypothetical protein
MPNDVPEIARKQVQINRQGLMTADIGVSNCCCDRRKDPTAQNRRA